MAEDIAYRAGIRQGVLAPNEGEDLVPIESIMSVSEAAKELGISNSAVAKAARAGRIKGRKIRRAWALLERCVRSYEVARYRVSAGKAARRA